MAKEDLRNTGAILDEKGYLSICPSLNCPFRYDRGAKVNTNRPKCLDEGIIKCNKILAERTFRRTLY